MNDIVRQAKSKLYVLGAGASIGAKRYPKCDWLQNTRMPSGKNFFYDLFIKNKSEEPLFPFMNSLGMLHEGLNDLIVKAWKINPEIEFFYPREWKGVNIEEIFTFFDVGTKMYRKNSSYHKAFLEGKESLIIFISYMILARTIGQRCLLLEKLFSERLSENDSVITFNWDTLAETTLENLGKPQYVNYVSLFDKEKIFSKSIAKRGMFIKLHGSTNWNYCINKGCLLYSQNQLIRGKDGKLSSLKIGDFDKCTCCGNHMKTNIIPPTSNKIEIHKDSFIHKQWLISRELLRYVGKIVFIGYSFPPTDYYSEWLFRQINFLNNFQHSQSLEIDVVNPEMFNKRNTTYKRYKAIFKGYKINVYKDLEVYCNKEP